MDIDNFFSGLAKTQTTQANAASAAKITANANRSFLEEVTARLAPLVTEYQSRLAKQNIRLDVTVHPGSISTVLKYKDGGHNGLTLKGTNSNRIEIVTFFTNDDGKNYNGTTGMTYDAQNWEDKFYEEALQKSISDYLYYAGRHGGTS